MNRPSTTRQILTRIATVSAAAVTTLALTGCNTMTGLGQDIMLLGHHAQVMVQGDDPIND